jgi:hypothetical protein
MKEVWKNIQKYEGYYQISNLGRLRSVDRVIKYKNGRLNKHKGREKNVKEYKTAYRIAILSKENKQKGFKISRLVAKHFIKNPNNYPCVNHIDGNKHNDRKENLEWCTYSYNNLHAFNNGLIKHSGIRGIIWDKNRLKWYAYLSRNNKDYFIGRFLNKEEAIKAREKYLNNFNYAYR